MCPESVAGIGGPDSMLGKSMSRYIFTCILLFWPSYAKPPSHNSMDEAAIATVCQQVAKPMKKVVRKTFEEAVFLVSLPSFI